jgi:serine/threonine-protein kinase
MSEPRSDEPTILAGRYEVGETIGRGAMGEVRLGRDVVLDRVVAVKLMHPHLTDDVGTRTRFEQEARLAAQLQHPNAVRVFDSGEHDGTPFIVMEHVDGETLADRIALGPLTTSEARRMGEEVLDALGAAHALGIVHRDVKPGNILLTGDGSAKLADFGIAKSAESSDHTAIGSIVGTLAYLAPERLHGAPATPQSDLYAVGAVLYEAVTGRKPFMSNTPVALLDEVRTTPAPDPRAVDEGIDRVLAQTIRRAMQKEPARRFADAATMRAALTPAPAPTAALPVPPVQLAGAAARTASSRRATVVWLSCGVAAAIALGAIVAGGDGAGGPSFLDPQVEVTPTTTPAAPPTTSVVVAARQTPTTTTSSTTTTTVADCVAGKGNKKKRCDEDD